MVGRTKRPTAAEAARMAKISFGTIDRLKGYRFGDDGSVWTLRIGSVWRELNQHKRGDYLRLVLTIDGRKLYPSVHHVIAEAFLGPRPSPKHHCCHNDGNAFNNALTNLRYDTAKGNAADKAKHGTQRRGELQWSAKLTQAAVLKIRALRGTMPVSEIARSYGIRTQNVYSILNRKTWAHVP